MAFAEGETSAIEPTVPCLTQRTPRSTSILASFDYEVACAWRETGSREAQSDSVGDETLEVDGARCCFE